MSNAADTNPAEINAGGTAKTPALGRSVAADLEALRNDVDQARELACDYQRQLAGKTNDHAHLKSLFEKTRDDLLHLQSGILQLREERHRFANEAMRAVAVEMKLERVTTERDTLQGEVTALHGRLAMESARVAQLMEEVQRLKPAASTRARTAHSRPEPAPVPEQISVPFFEAIDELNVVLVPTEAHSASAASVLRRRSHSG